MVSGKYKLEVVSKHPEFNGRTMVQHNIEGRNHIGVWGDEPFAIKFRNNSSERVQVRLSLDGTDILTTEAATIAPIGKMWVVEPWQTLELEAWPETNESGARFVFRSAENSVALHTHGDLSQKGVIAAAVYTEGYRPYYNHPTFLGGSLGGGRRGLETSLSLNNSAEACDVTFSDSTMKSASVGAGETVKQAIGTARGLNQPLLAEVVSLSYIWWDELKAKLQMKKIGEMKPTGFKDYTPPTYKMANLRNTPRMDRIEMPPVADSISIPDFHRIY